MCCFKVFLAAFYFSWKKKLQFCSEKMPKGDWLEPRFGVLVRDLKAILTFAWLAIHLSPHLQSRRLAARFIFYFAKAKIRRMFEGWLAGARCKVGHVAKRFHSMFVMTHFSFLPVIFFMRDCALCYNSMCLFSFLLSSFFTCEWLRTLHALLFLPRSAIFSVEWCNVATFSQPPEDTLLRSRKNARW